MTGSVRAILDGMNEKAFLAMVEDLARYGGWKTYHPWNSQKSEPGWPDLVIARRNSPLWIVELKSLRGRVTDAQWSWIGTLRTATGVRSEVWKPDDWERIERILLRAPGRGAKER